VSNTSNALRMFLIIAGLLTLFAGGFHALSGVYGDWFIGLVPSDVVDPSLDSQNRFYGAAFLLYGILFIFCSRDLPRYADILKIAFATMFLAGCARGFAVLAYGWPTWQVCALWSTEIGLPPIAWLWLNHTLKKMTGQWFLGSDCVLRSKAILTVAERV
jgi:Domain of unknown function (DUF4345)